MRCILHLQLLWQPRTSKAVLLPVHKLESLNQILMADGPHRSTRVPKKKLDQDFIYDEALESVFNSVSRKSVVSKGKVTRQRRMDRRTVSTCSSLSEASEIQVYKSNVCKCSSCSDINRNIPFLCAEREINVLSSVDYIASDSELVFEAKATVSVWSAVCLKTITLASRSSLSAGEDVHPLKRTFWTFQVIFYQCLLL